MESNHWLLRIGDGMSFDASTRHNIWGCKSASSEGKYFIKNAKAGDRMYFIKSGEKGRIHAVAIFKKNIKREIGALVSFSLTDEELGWTKKGYDTEIHYEELLMLNDTTFFTEIKGAVSIRLYNDKCKINLPDLYPMISLFIPVSTVVPVATSAPVTVAPASLPTSVRNSPVRKPLYECFKNLQKVRHTIKKQKSTIVGTYLYDKKSIVLNDGTSVKSLCGLANFHYKHLGLPSGKKDGWGTCEYEEQGRWFSTYDL